MLKNYEKYKVISAIMNHLDKSEDKKKTKILHLDCGSGELVEKLNEAGFEKVYGSDKDKEALTSARSRFNGKKNARFKVQDIEAKSIRKINPDLTIGFETSPIAFIPAGTKVILVTVFPNWEKACSELAPFIANGATTIQHGPYFVTYGTKK